MRIRAIRLDNVRRFTEPVSVGPVGDGVTLLCEPNEAGKSTLFDALHALFFARHTGFGKELKAMQPHSGGKVAVECDVEEDGALWRIRKRWQAGTGGEAKIWRDGVLVHQGDAAEDWLADRVVGERGGPGGLLWVRQGRVTLSAAEKKTKDEEQERRRDLLTAVSGALDQVTGGERMDRALDRVMEELGRLETATGRSRAGGALAVAEAEVADWESRAATLRGQVDAFRDELRALRRVEGDLAALEDPAAAKARARSVAEAAAALEAAARRADKVEAAAGRVRLATRELDAAREAAARGRAAREAADRAAEAERAAAAAERARATALAEAGGSFESADAAARGARAALRTADQTLRRVRRGAEAAAARGRRTALAMRLEEAEAAEAARIGAAARAAAGPDDRTVARIETLLRDRDAQHALREARAPSITFEAEDGATGLTLDGRVLAPGAPHPLPAGGAVGLPGLGRLRIDVPEGDGAALARAEAGLRAALAAGDWPDIGALRAAARARADAAAEADARRLARDAVAPDGIAALREALAALPPEEPEAEGGASDPTEAEAAVAEAARALARAEEVLAGARTRREDARVAAATAGADLRGVRDRLAAARAALDGLPEDDPARLDALAAEAERAAAAFAEVEAQAPNLEALRGKLDRLRGVEEADRRRAGALRERRAELRARIDARGEEGVEELLAEAVDELSTARDALERITFERDVLRRLRDALEGARSEARDAYFAPVAQELKPLLGDLWDDAELVWSDDTLLPMALLRRGTEEPVDVLSGGTQEQIAFLVRLAFARLLARSGRHAPLILDDALVYSDDDRIMKMFDALHGAAGDLQIIVLSCRQRVFRELGAPQLTFEPTGEAAE